MKSYKLSEFELELILFMLKDRRDKFGKLGEREKALAEKLGIYSIYLKNIEDK